MTLQQVLLSLNKEDIALIYYAFNNELSRLVNLPDKHFIGVYVKPTPAMEILIRQNNWVYGRYKE